VSTRHTNGGATAAEALGKTGNVIMKGNPGFVDIEAQDFALRPDSPAWKLGFKPIPFAQIGLQRDAYRRSLPVLEHVIRPGSRTFAGELAVTLRPSTRGEQSVLRYTLDGSEPGPKSPRYSRPLTVEGATTLKTAAFDADGPSSNRSQVVTATFTAARRGPVVGST
jgi:hypothetical protein